MKRFFMIVAVTGLLAASAFAQVEINSPEQAQTQQLQQRIMELYVSDFRNEVQLTEDQFLKVGPVIRNFIRMRFASAERRRLLNQQREQLLSQPNPSDADVQKLNEDTAQFERDAAMMETKFLGRIGPELTPRQQLLIPQFNRRFFDERLPDLLQRARELAAPPRGQQRQRPAVPTKQNQNRGNVQTRPGAANTLRDKTKSR